MAVIQIEHARQGFEDIASIYSLSCAVIEAQAEITDHSDRYGRPLDVVVVEALADNHSGAERVAAKLKLERADTTPEAQAGLVCWTGWLPQASQYDPVSVRLYAPTRDEGTTADEGIAP